MPKTVRGPAPRAYRKPITSVVAPPVRHAAIDHHVIRRRPEYVAPRTAQPRPSYEGSGDRFKSVKSKSVRRPAPRPRGLRETIERNLFRISVGLFVGGAVGWCLLIYNELRSPAPANQSATGYAISVAGKADYQSGKANSVGSSAFARNEYPQRVASSNYAGGESPASIVASEWGRLDAMRIAGRERNLAKPAAKTVNLIKTTNIKGPVRLASLEDAPQIAPLRPQPLAIPSHIRPSIGGAETAMVDFETAPFPYHGAMPGSGRPFLNAGEAGHRGHATFRGRVLWEAETFSDDRVLLHIPPGFDPSRPAVMVVFFHGHGADLARDVRDRQQVPAQITASGVNAVLVAPQFAFDAADSSAGKFWEPNGFKHFLDEAAVKLARLYGDPRKAFTFANMPVVIVAYSGGFGPTLSVLDRGGANSRIKGIVLLDALYAGIDTFANWVANNRSTFFVSSYTPHTAYHNADLERLLNAHSVPYSSELRRGNLPGMVSFLPAGPVSHRDFVNHAWADYPIKDILVRMDSVDRRMEPASTTASIPAPARN